jgi:hypothetical protein
MLSHWGLSFAQPKEPPDEHHWTGHASEGYGFAPWRRRWFFGVTQAGWVLIAPARPLDFVGWRQTTPQLAPKGKSGRGRALPTGKVDSFGSAVMAYQP